MDNSNNSSFHNIGNSNPTAKKEIRVTTSDCQLDKILLKNTWHGNPLTEEPREWPHELCPDEHVLHPPRPCGDAGGAHQGRVDQQGGVVEGHLAAVASAQEVQPVGHGRRRQGNGRAVRQGGHRRG